MCIRDRKSKEPILIEMEEFALENRVPIIEVEVARFLEFLVMLKKPKRILEIGTAIGCLLYTSRCV